jgi:hypothetical protein
MALIVGGTTVTGTQTLDATTLTGDLPAISGASLTGISSTSNTSAVSMTFAAVAGDGTYSTTAPNPGWVAVWYRNNSVRIGGNRNGGSVSVANANSATEYVRIIRISY